MQLKHVKMNFAVSMNDVIKTVDCMQKAGLLNMITGVFI